MHAVVAQYLYHKRAIAI